MRLLKNLCPNVGFSSVTCSPKHEAIKRRKIFSWQHTFLKKIGIRKKETEIQPITLAAILW